MGGAGFAVIKYDRVVFQAVHSRGELVSDCKTMQKCERVRSAQFPCGKSNTRSDATPSIDCSKHRLLVKWAFLGKFFWKPRGERHFVRKLYTKYFLLRNHAAWWTLAMAGFSMSHGRGEAVFLWHLVEVFPITVLSRGALCEEYFQWRHICGAKRHWQSCKSQHFEDVSHRQ